MMRLLWRRLAAPFQIARILLAHRRDPKESFHE